MNTLNELTRGSAQLVADDLEAEHLRGKVHVLESTLAQRQEEIAQLRAELEGMEAGASDVSSEEDVPAIVDQLQAKLADADAWVFKLARDRYDLEQRNALLDRNLIAISRQHDSTSRQLENLMEQSKGLNAEVRRLSAELNYAMSRHSAEVATLTDELRTRLSEIERLERLIRYKDNVLARAEYRAEWLRRTLSVLTRDHSRWFRNWLVLLMPTFVWLRRRRSGLREAGLFDGVAYLSLHPDVAASKTDPLRHYINHGILEGRSID